MRASSACQNARADRRLLEPAIGDDRGIPERRYDPGGMDGGAVWRASLVCRRSLCAPFEVSGAARAQHSSWLSRLVRVVVQPLRGSWSMGAGLNEPGAGDRGSTVEALYRSQWTPMVRLAWLMLGSREVAEDVVQDAFIRVASSWQRVQSPVAYLRTAVVNGARDHAAPVSTSSGPDGTAA